MSSQSSRAQHRLGFAAALAAYLAWGIFPVYWKQLQRVPAPEIIAHRVLWSFAVVAVLLTLWRRWGDFFRTVRSPRALAALLLSTALLSANWLSFIWAVNSGQVMQGSLGYYINPLLNVLLARLVLGERLRPLQRVAVVLASVGVLHLALGVGEVPWVALAVAGTFSLYGLVRKVAPVEPLTGLAAETSLALPVALLYLVTGTGAVAALSTREHLFLVGSGVVTALPLLWFAVGAKRLRYSTMGLIQYVAPTCQLGLAVLAYGEPFTQRHAVTFVFIWTAVVLYTLDALNVGRRSGPELALPSAGSTPSPR